MKSEIPVLFSSMDKFIDSKEEILKQWLAYETPKKILKLHLIDKEFFIQNYAGGVFDYFIGVISGELEIGNCPIMQDLLSYLKNREIEADELFEICSHFKRAMVDFTYDEGFNSKNIFDEISYIFDKNFRGILKYYTDTIFQKLIDARQEALSASQAKEYFLSNMSHEIRTPLNAILGFVQVLLDDDVSKTHRNYLDIIHNSGQNLLSIINDILDFSKLRSGEFTLDPKVFSLHDELSHTMELFVASANAKNISIISFIDPRIPIELYGDALRVKQILSNFLSNAIKFTPENGMIKIEASYTSGVLNVSVSDNGIGIHSQDLQTIFSAFAQSQHSVDSRSDGTGLGLSICNQLAQLMDAEVGVESTLGKGSTFFLKVPMQIHNKQSKVFKKIEEFQKLKTVFYIKDKKIGYKHESFIKYANIFNMNISVVDNLDGEFDLCLFIHEESSEDLLQKILLSDKKFIAIMSKKYDLYEENSHINSICFPLYCSKIHTAFEELINPEVYIPYAKKISQRYKGHLLIAEDSEANQELMKILLSKYGLTYDIANNGLEALELYKAKKYEMILMDEQMPVMNGNESIRKIIEYEESRGLGHTPSSVLTANVLKGARERNLLSGFDAFLGKPIVLKELERVFSSYLKSESISARLEQREEKQEVKIILGLNKAKLQKELLLEEDELLMLLNLFLVKMKKVLAQLSEAIADKDYKKIGLLSHSIKGSSSNFRIKNLQDISTEMEKAAKKDNSSYLYEKSLKEIVSIVDKIKIV
ncbi:response regulator [Sulfurimonas aquatica]|uniref:Sensory/regulatory protein RpfC n=1 Tax=Sulfurimonas aquatica TaxID=2672570 RepID=A0A975AZA4_9BACT|nr:hybrid sensor histidine kinase/response regulator [Sulfurimonas aquatica]QSZ41344.1 response regulator [Sulfurimonas aquatica]